MNILIAKLVYFRISVLVLLPMILYWFVVSSSVSHEQTAEDLETWIEFSKRHRLVRDDVDDINFIRQIQQAILKDVMNKTGVPHGELREPANVLRRGNGICHDRARVIRKFLVINGFKTRQGYIYAPQSIFGPLSLFLPKINSHTLVDVFTSKGWMAVGTNTDFVGMLQDGSVVSTRAISAYPAEKFIKPPHLIFSEKSYVIYGLLSRHGKFYPPYTNVPDIDYDDLKYNLWDKE